MSSRNNVKSMLIGLYLVGQALYSSVCDMKNFFCSFERHFEIKKNGVSLFEISGKILNKISLEILKQCS